MTDNDPRAQAEQRLAEKFAALAACPVEEWDKIAKLAAEEIANMAMALGVHCPSCDGLCGADLDEIPWHLVCADAESAKPEGGE